MLNNVIGMNGKPAFGRYLVEFGQPKTTQDKEKVREAKQTVYKTLENLRKNSGHVDYRHTPKGIEFFDPLNPEDRDYEGRTTITDYEGETKDILLEKAGYRYQSLINITKDNKHNKG